MSDRIKSALKYGTNATYKDILRNSIMGEYIEYRAIMPAFQAYPQAEISPLVYSVDRIKFRLPIFSWGMLALERSSLWWQTAGVRVFDLTYNPWDDEFLVHTKSYFSSTELTIDHLTDPWVLC